MSLSDSAIFESFFERQNGGRAIHLLQENFRAFAPAPAQERENWLALLLEQGQFGQNQFWQFSELTRTIYERTDPTGQFWQMDSALSFRFFVGSLLVLAKWTINIIQSHTLNPIEELAIRLLFCQRSRTHFQSMEPARLI